MKEFGLEFATVIGVEEKVEGGLEKEGLNNSNAVQTIALDWTKRKEHIKILKIFT